MNKIVGAYISAFVIIFCIVISLFCKQNALWTQVIIFTGVKPTEDKSEFVVSAKIVTYNTIEDAEFYIDKALV